MVNLFYAQFQDISEVGMIIYDCKVVASSFSNCIVQYVSRQANSSAYSLARATTSFFCPFNFSSPPHLLEDALLADL